MPLVVQRHAASGADAIEPIQEPGLVRDPLVQRVAKAGPFFDEHPVDVPGWSVQGSVPDVAVPLVQEIANAEAGV